jgi:predicted metal-dependent enzyme (double-stranded beta helix superfamily)
MVQDHHLSQVRNYRLKTCPETALAALLFKLERLVGDDPPVDTANAVREALMATIRADGSFIPERFLRPSEDCYARRLIYLGADRRFSLLAMVWAPGQRTPLHDHGGQWCVECVYCGEVVGTNYELEAQREDRFYFRKSSELREVEGQSSALVPPFDHHVLENRSDSVAVTLHVYANELRSCNAYVPADGGYVRRHVQLGYTA